MMTNSQSLTDTQLVLLSQASQHPDGKIIPPVHLRGGVFRRVMASLAGKGLVQSAPVSADGDAGQSEGDHEEACPVISAAGLAALGITVEGEAEANGRESQTMPGPRPEACDGPALGSGPEAGAGSDPTPELVPSDLATPDLSEHGPVSHAPHQPRPGSKQAQVLELLAHPEGATLDALMAATGWLPHTTRAVLSGLRKRGHLIDRIPGGEGGRSRYRLATPSLSPAGPVPASAPTA